MKTDAVLLASGFSKRFGENKLLLDLGGKPLFRHTADTVKACGIFENVLIVSQYDEILENAPGCIPLKNAHSNEGISASVKLGVKNSYAEHIMFFVCDQPFLSRKTILDFYGSFIESKKGMGFLKYDKTYGIPAVFSAKYKDGILELSGDSGAKSLSTKYPEDVFLYETENPFELKDCDTKGDFELIKKIFESKNNVNLNE